jgi:predicted nucleic acid-binding protein
MAVNHTVRATVVDIQHDFPKQEDAFLVDTNVWYWLAYSASTTTTARPYQTKDYPAFIKKAIAAKGQLYNCGLSLSELAHLIEGNERAIYNSRFKKDLKAKEFRRNSAERSNVVAEIQAAWGQVAAMSKMLDVTVNADATDRALQRMVVEPLDGYDLFILEAMSKAGIVCIITDDADYAAVPGIQVFTANYNVIQAARRQGRLLAR